MRKMANDDRIFQEVNVLSVIRQIGTLNKRTQARILQRVELSLDKDSKDYQELRKFILDEINGYTRSVVREIFGDIEYMMKN